MHSLQNFHSIAVWINCSIRMKKIKCYSVLARTSSDVVAKANKTLKSRSPGGSQSIPLSYPQLGRPPGTLCLPEKDMTLHSTFLLVFLSATLASCHLPTDQGAARELKESVRERRRIGQTRTQDRQSRSVSTLKVLDFSADGDQQPDSDNEYTGATLEAGPQ